MKDSLMTDRETITLLECCCYPIEEGRMGGAEEDEFMFHVVVFQSDVMIVAGTLTNKVRFFLAFSV